MEFPEMEAHIARLDDLLCRERGIHITVLRHPRGFEWMMFDEPKQQRRCLERRARLGVPPYGNGWPGVKVRWCTGQLKTHLISKEVNRLKKEKNALHYVGVAFDEAHRCEDDPHKRYPLVEWGITEAQACGNTTRSCGRGCEIWITVHGRSSAPAPWGSSRRIGAWSSWRNALPARKRRLGNSEAVFSPSGGPALAFAAPPILRFGQKGVVGNRTIRGTSRRSKTSKKAGRKPFGPCKGPHRQGRSSDYRCVRAARAGGAALLSENGASIRRRRSGSPSAFCRPAGSGKSMLGGKSPCVPFPYL